MFEFWRRNENLDLNQNRPIYRSIVNCNNVAEVKKLSEPELTPSRQYWYFNSQSFFRGGSGKEERIDEMKRGRKGAKKETKRYRYEFI